MKYYVLGRNEYEYVEMTMEEIQQQYGKYIYFECGLDVLVLTKIEDNAIYFEFAEYEC